jgi:signal transduction histidine kinase
MNSPDASETRVLICAPQGRDAQLIAEALQKSGLSAATTADVAELCCEVRRGAGAIIVTEEALGESVPQFARVLSEQPPWSDIPILVLTTGGEVHGDRTWELVRSLDPVGNVTLLERPLRSMTLVRAVEVSLRARERQYEMRTLQHELESRVLERTAELKRLNEEAEGFSYTISHDLRSPLRAIISTCGILKEDFKSELPSGAIEQLDRQSKAASRMAVLIDDLLKLSRLSREEMTPVTFDYSTLAENLANDIARRQPTQCGFEIQPGMEAHGDQLLIRFLLQNLLENACKFSPEGGTIEVGRNEEVYFVRDHGVGFDQQYSNKLFQPFQRLVDSKQFPGTGIGLTNAKRIVERHGGQIWAEGEPGRGATFYFTLG